MKNVLNSAICRDKLLVTDVSKKTNGLFKMRCWDFAKCPMIYRYQIGIKEYDRYN